MLPTTSRVFLGAIALFSSFQAVSAHGGVLQVTIDGQSYKGALPGGPPMDTMIRQVSQNGPVTDPTSMDMSCGYSTGPAPEVAPAKPGSNLKILWANSYTAHWIHFMGPIMTYMALCENNDCKTDKGTSNKWFKISELGQKSPGGDWYMKDLFNGEPYSVQIPTGLPDGQYLLRSELIALHRAQSSGGAEFYPSCMQLSISGGKASTSALSTVPTTMFPGAYKASDPGILVDVYQAGFNYAGKFPGPPLASLLGTGGGLGNGGGDKNTSTTPSKKMSTAVVKSLPTTSIGVPLNVGNNATTTITSPTPVPTSISHKGSHTPSYTVVTLTLTVPLGKNGKPDPIPTSSIIESIRNSVLHVKPTHMPTHNHTTTSHASVPTHLHDVGDCSEHESNTMTRSAMHPKRTADVAGDDEFWLEKRHHGRRRAWMSREMR